MKKLIGMVLGLNWSLLATALSGQAYMERFNHYWAWYEQLPIHPSQDFIAFIQETTPLANKLREKWLYELARTKNWSDFNTYYQPSKDSNLVCYKGLAQWNSGQKAQALQTAIPLWLSAFSQPKPCNLLFDALLKSPEFDQKLITERLALALDKNNTQLAAYLLKQYKVPQLQQIQTLTALVKNPRVIQGLNAGVINPYFYLYALKRLVAIHMDQAIQIWQNPKTQKILNEAQKQNFIAHVALYKAMRHHADAHLWFAQLKPSYSNESLSDWQIRFALKNKDWSKVKELIQQASNKDTPIWQYWLARALEQLGQKTEAVALYQSLAKNRHYYGFLASNRLKQKPNFDNEAPVRDLNLLKPYQSLLNQIQVFYRQKQQLQASRLLNDFISELPKDESSALVYWVATHLNWYGKSVYLSSNETLNNQLALRFPLAYQDQIKFYANKYALAPEFIYAIIRQESAFREDVISSAGAKGLMQIMPYTASLVSRADRIPFTDQKQLFLPQKNINIGIAYLKQLAKRFSHHPILIAAAYNAGPKQVVFWLKNNPAKEIDLWIETLAWQETRNYLKNIMAFYLVYQYRLNQKPDVKDFMTPLYF